MANYSVTLDNVFHALADPTRRSVLHQLGSGDAAISELARPFKMALPSFMKHIRVLEESGLVITKKKGRVRTCKLNAKKLTTAEEWLAEQQAVWESRTDRLASYIETNLAKEEK